MFLNLVYLYLDFANFLYYFIINLLYQVSTAKFNPAYFFEFLAISNVNSKKSGFVKKDFVMHFNQTEFSFTLNLFV
jgi:hypothetical protein